MGECDRGSEDGLKLYRLVTVAGMGAILLGIALGATSNGSRASRVSGHAMFRRQNSACVSYKGERVFADYYIADPASWQVVSFKASATGPSVPLCVFTNPGLLLVGGMVDDPSGKLWVMDSKSQTLMAFPRDASGQAVPSQIISGSNTSLRAISAIQNIAIDASGDVWVPCQKKARGYLVAFANNANGNVSPVMTIGLGDNGRRGGFAEPMGVAFDHEGNLYVANFTPYKVLGFSPPFSDTSRPVATWSPAPSGGESSMSASVDGQDNLWIGGFSSIEVYAGGLRAHGVVSKTFTPVGATGFYDVFADGRKRVFEAMIGGAHGSFPAAIGVLPAKATTFGQAQFISSSELPYSPQTVTAGP